MKKKSKTATVAMPKKVFISGRIRGCPDLSHFSEAVEYIESLGHIAVNPERLLDVFRGIPDDNHEDAKNQQWNITFWMREALRLLLDSDAIYFCPNMDSEGMKLERHIADVMKLPVIAGKKPAKEEEQDFVECQTCAKQSGSPVLCPSCLQNRKLISDLQRQLRMFRQ